MKISTPKLPFLARFATDRTEENHIPGHYCYEQDVWVVKDKEKHIPIISKFTLTETVTKTKVRQESDDESSISMLEPATKTGVQLERDDTDLSICHLLELMTKTDTVQERDDEPWNSENWVELATKTFVAVERDEDSMLYV